MSNFQLNAGDILININDRHDLYSMVKRWLVGPYDHVFMYMGVLSSPTGIRSAPILFESNGRGIVLQSLSNRYGQRVVVLRLKSGVDRQEIPRVIEEAIKLASDPKGYYDYLCIVKYVLPRLICRKFGLPTPLKWHRDERQICSEAVFEVFYRAGLVDILLPYCIPPMPGDFVTDSVLFEVVWDNKLSEKVV